MGGYTEPERSELLAALKDDGVRNLEQLVRLKEEEITGLANWDRHSARQFLEHVEKLARAMGWRAPQVVYAQAQAQPEVVVQATRRERQFPSPPTGNDTVHTGRGPFGSADAFEIWGYSIPGWAADHCSNGELSRQALVHLLRDPTATTAQVQKIALGDANDALLQQRFVEVANMEQLQWLTPAVTRGSSFMDTLVRVMSRRSADIGARKSEALDTFMAMGEVASIQELAEWLQKYDANLQAVQQLGVKVPEEVTMVVLSRVKVKMCIEVKERCEHLAKHEHGTVVTAAYLMQLYTEQSRKYEIDKVKNKEKQKEGGKGEKKKRGWQQALPAPHRKAAAPSAAAAAPKKKDTKCWRFKKEQRLPAGPAAPWPMIA